MFDTFIEKLKETHPSISDIHVGEEIDGKSSFVVVVNPYNLKTNRVILNAIYKWMGEEEKILLPLVVTKQEAERMSIFSDMTQMVSPKEIIANYKEGEGYPANARRHILGAIEEITLLLRGVEQEFPTSGLHALNTGQKIQTLFEKLLQWGALVYEKEFETNEEAWEFLKAQAPKKYKLDKLTFESYPFHLEAFLRRNEMLASLHPRTYGDNDLELEEFITPLLSLANFLKNEVTLKFTPAEERQATKRRWLWGTTSTIAILGITAVVLYFVLRPPTLSAISLPKGVKKGGIVGSYYKGRKLKTFLNKRLDRALNMYWPRSPLNKVPGNRFSVRWKGFIKAPVTGTYRICYRYDDGGRLYLGNKTLVDDWHGGRVRMKCKELRLEKGWHKLRAEMFEVNGPAQVKLSWSYPTRRGLHPVPSSHLACKR